ncbi:MAG: hypothetical protein BAJALOKI1v1_1940004 [Promethearchaeota archaeon]|nr:MAG: hypothetical protein BAJALOKI1v1_1940004 [Candidatus Lokiarchaeota archaeon]
MKKKAYIGFIFCALLLLFFIQSNSTNEYNLPIRRNNINPISISSESIDVLIKTDEFQVNNYTSNNQIHPTLCALSEDTFAVAWSSQVQDGSQYGIYASVFNATTGQNTTAEFRVNYNTNNFQWYPDIAALSEDLFVVAWQSLEQDSDEYGIYARVFNATTGQNTTAEFRVNYNTTDDQQNPSVAALSEDSFVVAWQTNETYDENDLWNVKARVFNATTGENITAEFQVNHFTDLDQFLPDISALSEDLFAVTWASWGQDGSSMGIFANVFNATTGINITAEFQVNDYYVNYQSYPSICALSEDTIAVAWEDWIQEESLNRGIYARLFNATTGTNITAEFHANFNTTDNQERPSISALTEDSLVITWRSNGQDGNGYGVFGRIFNATTGTNFTAEFQVNNYTTNNQEFPDIATLSEDNFAIAWESFEQDTGEDIYSRVLYLNYPPIHSGEPPSDFSYTYGSTGNEIIWTFIDDTISTPNYTVYNNNISISIHTNKLWSSGVPITVDVDGLAVGNYNFTIIIEDGLGGITQDQVNITVNETEGNDRGGNLGLILALAETPSIENIPSYPLTFLTLTLIISIISIIQMIRKRSYFL